MILAKKTEMYIYDMFNAKILSKRVLLSRRDLDMGQEELSAAAKVSQAYISKIERGRTDNVGIETIFSLAQALNVSPAYLLGLTDDPLRGIDDDIDEEEIGADGGGWPPLAARLADLATELPDEVVQSLVSLAEQYVEQEREKDGNELRALLVEARRKHGDAFADQLIELMRTSVDAMSR